MSVVKSITSRFKKYKNVCKVFRLFIDKLHYHEKGVWTREPGIKIAKE
jgi:hypothetical protein